MVSFPLGPYHPALVQPLALTVKLRGERMAAVYSPRAGYCSRNIDVLVRGKPIPQALALVERSCALAGQTHRTVACQAIEDAWRIAPSHQAILLRAAFGEIERLLARLWTLGLSARAAGLDALWRTALEHRETLFAALYRVTGQRSFWSIARPGGVRQFDPPLDSDALLTALVQLEPALDSWRTAASSRGPLGRAAAGAGILDETRARTLKVKGIAARAAGPDDDLRRDAPDDAYTAVADMWPAERSEPGCGDAAARLMVAAEDLITSIRLARGLFETARDAGDVLVVLDVAATPAPQPGVADLVEGSATREGPHGPVTVSLALAPDGTVANLRLLTPIAGVLAALPEVLREQPVARAPLIVASLDLCVECLDL